MTTTERIFELIKENNLTAKEFAFICGLSQGNITDWKTGRSKPSIEALKKISSAFNVNIDWLLGDNSIKEKENMDKDIRIPDDFKYYIEDLPECIIYRIKYITYILLITSKDFSSLETEIELEMSIGKIPKRYYRDTKKAIIYLFNYNVQFLMQTNHRNSNMHKLISINTNYNLPSKYYMCPVYGQISAGMPNWAEECIEGRIPIAPDMMDILNPEEYFFLRVNGESMNEVVKDGAFALIHKQDVVENGDIAVVLVNGYDATLKKFTKQGDLVLLEPQSTDNRFTTQVYDKSTSIVVLGKYVGKMEINK